LLFCLFTIDRSYRNVCNMSFVSFSLADNSFKSVDSRIICF